MYTIAKSTDGTEETFDIRTPEGRVLCSIPFWYNESQARADAELIANALNRP